MLLVLRLSSLLHDDSGRLIHAASAVGLSCGLHAIAVGAAACVWRQRAVVRAYYLTKDARRYRNSDLDEASEIESHFASSRRSKLQLPLRVRKHVLTAQQEEALHAGRTGCKVMLRIRLGSRGTDTKVKLLERYLQLCVA